MQGQRRFIGLRAGLTVFAVSLLVSGTAASQENVLHSFGEGLHDGIDPDALIFNAAGNLYGTTYEGGVNNWGTLFEMVPKEGGGWTEKVLHNFNDDGTHGTNPIGGVIMDSAGNLYGTTEYGGVHEAGTVFELSPNLGEGWTETVLHSFGNGTDGAGPYAPLIMDGGGNLYGTTYGGGIHDTCPPETCGTVFELSPNGSGGWTETVLHNFGNGTDGANPNAGLIFDAAGNLYGTTDFGGIHDTCDLGACGTLFELSPDGSGGWTQRVLHSFGGGTDGFVPGGSLIFDAAGNLYGTAGQGGIHGYGTAYKFTP